MNLAFAGSTTEQPLHKFAEIYGLPISVRKKTWYGAFYFTVEEITPTGKANGKRYRNDNLHDIWSCSKNDLFVLYDAFSHSQNIVKNDPSDNEQKTKFSESAPENVPNPNKLSLNKSSYISGSTRLFIRHSDGKIVPARFCRFDTKNGKDVIYLESEGKITFYPFPQSERVFPNRDDALAVSAKEKRSLNPDSFSIDSSRILLGYNKLPVSKRPYNNKNEEFSYEKNYHNQVSDKLYTDLEPYEKNLAEAENFLSHAGSRYSLACREQFESGFFDEHTFISLQINNDRYSDKKKTAEYHIYRIKEKIDKPYFGRVDCGKNIDDVHTAYIGASDIPGYVVDWRHSEIGNAYYHSNLLSSTGNMVIALKRTFDIEYGKFHGFDDEINIYNTDFSGADDASIENHTDAYLTKLLAASRENKTVHDIIKTLQSEQYDIITYDFHKNALINGCAGSGKTMILYHRLSYMAYNYKSRTGMDFEPKNVYIISPSIYFDTSNDILLQKLSIDSVNHGTLESHVNKLISEYCGNMDIVPASGLLSSLENNGNSFADFYNEKSFDQFFEYVENIDSLPVLRNNYYRWLSDIAWKLVSKNGFELPEDKKNFDSEEYFNRLYRNSCFIKPKTGSKENEKTEYYQKWSIIMNSFDDILYDLEKFDKEESRYQSRIRKLERYKGILQMCVSNQKHSPHESRKTALGDFWNIFEKTTVFEKMCSLITAEKLLEISRTEKSGARDFLLKCAFIYHNFFGTRYDLSGLYFLKALADKFGAIENGPVFIFVDEFQNYSGFELSCLKGAFSEPIFNFYGDFDQRIESKGTEIHSVLEEMFEPQIFSLNVNYRNAKQITEYINLAVQKNMNSIGIDGTVSELKYSNCEFAKHDRTAIIAKDVNLVKKLLQLRFGKNFPNVLSETQKFDENSVMLLSVPECKGLEFDTVYVFSDGMSENEKYVAYTRALDSLNIITDKDINEILSSEETRLEEEKRKKAKSKV